MYARILKLTLAGGKTRATAEAMADAAYNLYKSQKGFVSATFLIHDESKGEYGSVVLWETKEDVEAGTEKVRSLVMEKFGDMLAGPPDAQIIEAYKPK